MLINWARTAFAVSMLVFLSNAGFAEDSISDLKREIETLKQGQQAILQQLRDLAVLILQRPSNPGSPDLNIKGTEFELGSNPIRGDNSAKLILVDFTDYQCPFCGRYSRETLPQLLKQYVESGKIRYTVVDVPLANHEFAPKAAEATRCANEQGKYWEMHDLLMGKQESLGDLSSYAVSSNLDLPQFEDCLNSNRYSETIARDMSRASKLGISAVPGFILAHIGPENSRKLTGIGSIRGAQPLSVFQREIDKALADLER